MPSTTPRPPLRPSFASVVQLKHAAVAKSTADLQCPANHASGPMQTKAASPNTTSRRRGQTSNCRSKDANDPNAFGQLESSDTDATRENEKGCATNSGVSRGRQVSKAGGELPQTGDNNTSVSGNNTNESAQKGSMKVLSSQVKAATSPGCATHSAENESQPRMVANRSSGAAAEDNVQIFQSPSTVATTSTAEASSSWASPPSVGDTSSLSPASVSSNTSPFAPSPHSAKHPRDKPNTVVNDAGNTNGNNIDEADGSVPSTATHGLSMLQLRRRLAILSKEQLLEVCTYGMYRYDDIFYAGEALLETDPASRRVMVRGLWFCTTDASFRRYFEQFGELENAAIIRQPDGRSQGYGFLIYKDRFAAQKVIEQRHVLDDRAVTAKLAADQYTEFSCNNEGQSVSLEKRKLFIRNICSEITKDILEREFSVYGPIEECAIIRTAVGVSKGYGFVTFSKSVDAQRAAQIPFRVINGWVVFVTFSTGKARTRMPNTGNGRQPQQQQFHAGDAAQQVSVVNSEIEGGYQSHQFPAQYGLRSKGYGASPESGSCYFAAGGGQAGRQPSRAPPFAQKPFGYEKSGISKGIPIVQTRAPSALKDYYNEGHGEHLSHGGDAYGSSANYDPTEKPFSWNDTPDRMNNEVHNNTLPLGGSVFGNTPGAHGLGTAYMRAVRNGDNESSILSLLAELPSRRTRDAQSRKATMRSSLNGSFFEDSGVSETQPRGSDMCTAAVATGMSARRSSVRWKDESLSGKEPVANCETENKSYSALRKTKHGTVYSQTTANAPLRNDSFWEDGDGDSAEDMSNFLQSHNADDASKSSFFAGGGRLISNMTNSSCIKKLSGNAERDAELTGARPTMVPDTFPLLRGAGLKNRRRRTTGGSVFLLDAPDEFLLSDGCNSFASTGVQDTTLSGLSSVGGVLSTRHSGIESQGHAQSRTALFPFASQDACEGESSATQVDSVLAHENDTRSSPFDGCAKTKGSEKMDVATLGRLDPLSQTGLPRTTPVNSGPRRFSLPFSENPLRGVHLDENAIADMIKTQGGRNATRAKSGFFRVHCRGTRHELASQEKATPGGLRFDSRAYTGGGYLGTAASKAAAELAFSSQHEDQGAPGLSGQSLEIFTPLYSRTTTAITAAMGNEPLFSAIGTLSTLNSIDFNLDSTAAPRFPSFGGNFEQLFGNSSAQLSVGADGGDARVNSNNGFLAAMGFSDVPPGLTGSGGDDEALFPRKLSADPTERGEVSNGSDMDGESASHAHRHLGSASVNEAMSESILQSSVSRGANPSEMGPFVTNEDAIIAQNDKEVGRTNAGQPDT